MNCPECSALGTTTDESDKYCWICNDENKIIKRMDEGVITSPPSWCPRNKDIHEINS